MLVRTIDTVIHCLRALPGAAGRLSQAVVFHAIAIVIEQIACFRGRQHLADASPPGAIRTRLRALLANTDAIRSGSPRITRLSRPVGAGAPFVGFVDLPVAILIESIAFRSSRCARSTSLGYAIVTRIHRDLTYAHTARELAKTIVDLAIAIFVFTVANIGRPARKYLAGACRIPLAIDTGQGSSLAFANAVGHWITGITGHRFPRVADGIATALTPASTLSTPGSSSALSGPTAPLSGSTTRASAGGSFSSLTAHASSTAAGAPSRCSRACRCRGTIAASHGDASRCYDKQSQDVGATRKTSHERLLMAMNDIVAYSQRPCKEIDRRVRRFSATSTECSSLRNAALMTAADEGTLILSRASQRSASSQRFW